jgi:hypothetical protein
MRKQASAEFQFTCFTLPIQMRVSSESSLINRVRRGIIPLMNMLLHLALFVCILLLMACTIPGNSPEPQANSPAKSPANSGAPAPRDFPLRTLAKGAHSGIQEAKRERIKTPDVWDRLWEKHSVRTPPEEKPAVNFDQEMVIAMTMGRRRTGGYAIEITEVRAVENRLRIEYQQSTPPEGAMTIQVLTAPFHFVAVPRSDLEPEFVEMPLPDRRGKSR